MTIDDWTAAAMDAGDWPSAALGMLANPLSKPLGKEFAEPLSKIVFSGDESDAEAICQNAYALICELDKVVNGDA